MWSKKRILWKLVWHKVFFFFPFFMRRHTVHCKSVHLIGKCACVHEDAASSSFLQRFDSSTEIHKKHTERRVDSDSELTVLPTKEQGCLSIASWGKCWPPGNGCIWRKAESRVSSNCFSYSSCSRDYCDKWQVQIGGFWKLYISPNKEKKSHYFRE